MEIQSETLPSPWPIAQMRKFCLGIQPGFARQPNDIAEGTLQLRMPSISRSGFIDFTVSKFVDATDVERSKYGVRKGDVIFNNTNSPDLVGNAAVFDHDVECVFSNHMTRIRFNKNVILPSFLAAVLHRYWVTGQTQKRSKQWVNQAAIDVDNLSSFRIPLPPLSEQQRIVDIFQEAEKIRRLRAEAEDKTAELIPAIFFETFGDLYSGKTPFPIRPLSSFGE
jgi:type I restriction enzyme S subunit